MPPLIYSLPQKLRAIESLGADHLLLIHFDEKFSEQTGEAFVRGLARDLGHIQSLCVGANFVFGHKRGGNVELLKKLGAELNFHVHGLAAVSLDGRAVSSTRIREAIRAGESGRAPARCWAALRDLPAGWWKATSLGRKLGFPTANLDVAGLVLPPHGVYAGCALTGKEILSRRVEHRLPPDGGSGQTRASRGSALLDFSGRLYGAELEWKSAKNSGTRESLTRRRNCGRKSPATCRGARTGLIVTYKMLISIS